MVGSSYYRILFEALRTRSMAEVARAAYEILHMPIVVTDIVYIVRAKYPDVPLDDEQWDANKMNRQIEPRFVKIFTEDDHFSRHEQAGKAILIDWGYFASTPRLTVELRSHSGQLLGYLSALATGVDVQEWHYEATDIVGEAFSMLMEADAGMKIASGGASSAALFALLNGDLDEAITADSLPVDFVEANRPPYLLFCACPRNPHFVPLEAYMGNVLAKYFECAVQADYNGYLYILASNVSKDARGSVRGNMLVEELDRQGLASGVSRMFEDLKEVRLRSWEAQKALEINTKLQLSESLSHYEDYIAEIAFDTLMSVLPEGALEHPTLACLKRHDADNNTEYLKTLEAYYCCDFDKKLTSEVLHIHRNTLQYRLSKIKELLVIGKEEPYYMLLYFGMENYQNRLAAADRKRIGDDRGEKGR